MNDDDHNDDDEVVVMMVMLMVVGLGNGLRWVRERSRGKESGNGSRKRVGERVGERGIAAPHASARTLIPWKAPPRRRHRQRGGPSTDLHR